MSEEQKGGTGEARVRWWQFAAVLLWLGIVATRWSGRLTQWAARKCGFANPTIAIDSKTGGWVLDLNDGRVPYYHGDVSRIRLPAMHPATPTPEASHE